MPVSIFCPVVMANGQQCGYEPKGDTAKAKLTDLFKHQQGHLAHVQDDGKGHVTVRQ